MIVGMTMASVSVSAQDAKSTSSPVKKEASTCCKSGDKTACTKSCSKETAVNASKDASTTSENVSGKAGACCKSKTATTASEAKVSKTVN